MTRKLAIAGAAVVTVAAVSGGVAIAGSRGGEEPLTGSTLDRAADAALAHTKGGTVLEAEQGDGGSAYEVEVRLANGSTVEVNLDGQFRVVGSGADDESGQNENETENESEGADD